MTVHSSGVPQQLVLQSTLRSTAQNSPKTCEGAATQLVLQSEAKCHAVHAGHFRILDVEA